MYAAALGHTEIATMLVDAGADVNKICAKHGVNALCVALLAGNIDVARILIDHNADVKADRSRFPDLVEKYAALGCCEPAGRIC